jgi:hypothetical protein
MHNIYLQTALDVGLFGWLAFIGYILITIFQTEKLIKRLRREGPADAYWMAVSAEALMLTVVIFGFQVDVFFFPLKAWWLVASIMGAFYLRIFRPLAASPRSMQTPVLDLGWHRNASAAI